MGTPSPELKKLWVRVLKRVHPDLAIDEYDRVRCERLTQLANEAYQAGDEEALRAVLRPSQPACAATPQAYSRSRQRQRVSPAPADPTVQQGSPTPKAAPRRSLKLWFQLSNVSPLTPFSFKPFLPVAIGAVILICGGFSLYSLTTSRHSLTDSPTAQAPGVKAPLQSHVEAADAGKSKPYGHVMQNHISENLNPFTVVDTAVVGSRESSPTKVPVQDPHQATLKTNPPVANSVEPSHLYMDQMRERLYQSFNNQEWVDANVPPGNSAELWFDVNRDGSLSNVRVGKPSGWNSLDYACVRAVQRAGTVGALPEDYKLRALPATFACSYTGSNALRIPKSVDSARDSSDLYVGSVRDTTHQ